MKATYHTVTITDAAYTAATRLIEGWSSKMTYATPELKELTQYGFVAKQTKKNVYDPFTDSFGDEEYHLLTLDGVAFFRALRGIREGRRIEILESKKVA